MPSRYEETTLTNGLRVVAEIDPGAHSAAIGFHVRTGARDEDPRIMGVSHFLEHMMFKGSDTRSAEDVDRDFDALGAVHNAWTSSEMTAFWAHCLPEHLPEATAILADILRPALRDEDFEAEKKVILEEIAMYEDQPGWVLMERASETYYDDHGLGHRVLGTNATIGDLSAEDMRAYFQQQYGADNIVVAMAGRLNLPAMLDALEACCGAWRAGGPGPRTDPVEPARGDFTQHREALQQHYLIMLWPGPSLADDRRYAVAMLMHVLGGNDASRLHWALVDPGLAEDASASWIGQDGSGECAVVCCGAPSDAARIEAVVGEQIEGLLTSITDDDLHRVRSAVATAVTLRGELPAGRMHRLGHLLASTGDYRSLEEELVRIESVTLEDLVDAAADFPLQPLVTGRLAPAT